MEEMSARWESGLRVPERREAEMEATRRDSRARVVGRESWVRRYW